MIDQTTERSIALPKPVLNEKVSVLTQGELSRNPMPILDKERMVLENDMAQQVRENVIVTAINQKAEISDNPDHLDRDKAFIYAFDAGIAYSGNWDEDIRKQQDRLKISTPDQRSAFLVGLELRARSLNLPNSAVTMLRGAFADVKPRFQDRNSPEFAALARLHEELVSLGGPDHGLGMLEDSALASGINLPEVGTRQTEARTQLVKEQLHRAQEKIAADMVSAEGVNDALYGGVDNALKKLQLDPKSFSITDQDKPAEIAKKNRQQKAAALGFSVGMNNDIKRTMQSLANMTPEDVYNNIDGYSGTESDRLLLTSTEGQKSLLVGNLIRAVIRSEPDYHHAHLADITSGLNKVAGSDAVNNVMEGLIDGLSHGNLPDEIVARIDKTVTDMKLEGVDSLANRLQQQKLTTESRVADESKIDKLRNDLKGL